MLRGEHGREVNSMTSAINLITTDRQHLKQLTPKDAAVLLQIASRLHALLHGSVWAAVSSDATEHKKPVHSHRPRATVANRTVR